MTNKEYVAMLEKEKRWNETHQGRNADYSRGLIAGLTIAIVMVKQAEATQETIDTLRNGK